jgi:crotonobetaine/carnitine-CoA ligase
MGFMDGYYDDPVATASVFRNGWLHTGDLATRSVDGLLYYKGRTKEMIRRAGENIAPVEIETALMSHVAVLECAVAAVPDPDLGEEAKAYVVLSPDADTTVEELHAFLRARIASFKVPRYWELRDSLPHTASEKVAKHQLESGRTSFLEGTTDLRPGQRMRAEGRRMRPSAP